MMTMFVDTIPVKRLQDFTRPLKMPRVLKGLLYMLNAIVHPKSEGFILLFCSFISCCVLLRD
jgi:hypothetical protein